MACWPYVPSGAEKISYTNFFKFKFFERFIFSIDFPKSQIGFCLGINVLKISSRTMHIVPYRNSPYHNKLVPLYFQTLSSNNHFRPEAIPGEVLHKT